MDTATCVFTCKYWFSISRITCLIIFSGSSARSIMSFRFARIKVPTRSKSPMIFLLYKKTVSPAQHRHSESHQMLQYKPQVTANMRNHHAGDHDDQQPQYKRLPFHLHDPSPSGIPRKELLGRSRDLPSPRIVRSYWVAMAVPA